MRDDFNKQTIDILAKRVGNRCSNPSCRKLTSGPTKDPNYALNIGVAAHIFAASPGGPRYDSAMMPEERQSVQNGIWLCQNCGKLIDNDASRYNPQLLYGWKKQSEENALKEIECCGNRNIDKKYFVNEKYNFEIESKGKIYIVPLVMREISIKHKKLYIWCSPLRHLNGVPIQRDKFHKMASAIKGYFKNDKFRPQLDILIKEGAIVVKDKIFKSDDLFVDTKCDDLLIDINLLNYNLQNNKSIKI